MESDSASLAYNQLLRKLTTILYDELNLTPATEQQTHFNYNFNHHNNLPEQLQRTLSDAFSDCSVRMRLNSTANAPEQGDSDNLNQELSVEDSFRNSNAEMQKVLGKFVTLPDNAISCAWIAQLVQFCGARHVCASFPTANSTALLCNLLEVLESGKLQYWQEKFALMHWLSVLVLAPFPLTTISGKDLFERILQIGKEKLFKNSSEIFFWGVFLSGRDFILSHTGEFSPAITTIIRLLFRKDSSWNSISSFLDWILHILEQKNLGGIVEMPSTVSRIRGLQCLFEFLKIGHNNNLVQKWCCDHFDRFLYFASRQPSQVDSVFERKMWMKVLQRLTCMLLPTPECDYRIISSKRTFL